MQIIGFRFLGVGNQWDRELGNPAAVVELAESMANQSNQSLKSGAVHLMIDCGSDTLQRYQDDFGDQAYPDAIYITHVHLDHIAGLETLFIRAYLNEKIRGKIKLFVPVSIIPDLHQRMAAHPHPVAEKGVNFWEVFHVIPVDKGFWLQGCWFDVTPARHHWPDSSFGLAVKGHFIYTGDTRPIPVALNQYAAHGETIFHDCSLTGNPSHSGIEDLEREYTPELLNRLVLYHYENEQAGEQLKQRGYRIAMPGLNYMT